MAAKKEFQNGFENVLSRSGREVFVGDWERRRPTKRMTTVRSFAVARNWVNEQNKQKSNEVSSSSNTQSAQVSSRSDLPHPRTKSRKLSHEPLGFQDVYPMSQSDNDDEVQIPSLPGNNDVDSPPIASSTKHSVGAEPSSDVSHEESREGADVIPMATDDGPMNDELPRHSSEESLPCGEASVSVTVRSNVVGKPLSEKVGGSSSKDVENDDNDVDEDDDGDLNVFEERTPAKQDKSSVRESVGLQSGQHAIQPRAVARKRVAFTRKTNNNEQPRVDEDEYEAQNFVRLFNADRGRKGGGSEVTDLDVVMTNIEEVALEIKSKTDSALTKKLVREAFIQIRHLLSNSIDINKEKKYLQSATIKTNSKLKKMKQELLNLQAKRKRTEAKLESLESECGIMEKRIKSKEEAYTFISEFENFQKKLRRGETADSQEEHGEESLPSLLCEASGYLSTHRQLQNINDKLQLWLDKNI